MLAKAGKTCKMRMSSQLGLWLDVVLRARRDLLPHWTLSEVVEEALRAAAAPSLVSAVIQ